ncbi:MULTISPECIES: IS3 family transposase [unclassified Mycobacterium]|uniref:IS3 family transposase n=1 Tax=unclassified Mycobacterium TaxID=2642494 RepID=UPI003204E21E
MAQQRGRWAEGSCGAPCAGLDAAVAAAHEASGGVYGAPRILADLREKGRTVSRKTVAASLARQGLAGISPRSFAPPTTVVDLDAPPIPDLVKRRFDAGELNRVWTSPPRAAGWGRAPGTGV